MKNVDLSPLSKAGNDLWELVRPLFAEHAFLTIVCAALAVMMTLSFYRLLKSISPALVGFILVLILGVLMLHWTITRTEPSILTPFVDQIAPFFPSAPEYPQGKKPDEKTKAKPAPAKPKTPPAKS